MAVIYMKGRDGKLEEIGRTEVVLNSLNPTWIKKVNVTYHFEVVQTLVYASYLPSMLLLICMMKFTWMISLNPISSWLSGFVFMMSILSFTI